jgi:hypothetical protein
VVALSFGSIDLVIADALWDRRSTDSLLPLWWLCRRLCWDFFRSCDISRVQRWRHQFQEDPAVDHDEASMRVRRYYDQLGDQERDR